MVLRLYSSYGWKQAVRERAFMMLEINCHWYSCVFNKLWCVTSTDFRGCYLGERSLS